MIFNTQNIPEGRSVVAHTINNSDEYPDLPQIPSGIICRCNIDRKGKDIAVDVEYAGAVKLSCARCLELFSQQVNGRIYVILQYSQDTKDLDDEHSVFYYNDQSPDVNITAALFDEIMTSLPLMPLCRENCPGIVASQTGKATAKKSEAATDPRWEALKKLKQ